MITLFDVEDKRIAEFLLRLPEFVHPSWLGFKAFSKDFLSPIIGDILKDKDAGIQIYPSAGVMFRVFKECSLEDSKVVFVAQDPYHQRGVADGFAFSCGNTKREQPSLRLIFDEISRTVDNNYKRDPDLIRWVNQGVMPMNTAFTVQQGIPSSHSHIWKNFTTLLLRELSVRRKELIFVLVGRHAQVYESFLPNSINVIHPAAAAHRGGNWDSNDVFNKINKILITQDRKEIIW